MRRARRIAMGAAAALLGAFAVAAWADPPTSAPPSFAAADLRSPIGASKSNAALLREGHALFEEGCSSCHGFDGEGVEGQAPSLRGAGEAAADFYLRTGRMPLDQVGDEPLRGEPAYDEGEIEALVAYVGSLGPGPEIPVVEPAKGSLSEGFQLFAESCEGCHGVGGKGGVVIGGYAPPLGESTPTEVGEAIRVGPFLMPHFSARQLSDGEVDSIARYVELTKEPDDAGGFGIGHIGPVPEGLVAWAAGIAALLLVARLIGERGEDEGEGPDEEGGS
jgi:ubiquinol-cytochrome c reductase cytochrome c subunit